ncbi:hypothetical protein KFE25_001938 [Diacronema lutheri]|uniref:HSF-type DNA-binding domain-containing protein n=1 Tax=Diacronema lutheri TaxID=2081491 RepID=A0A8J5XKQ4_DIALT|nr:hypothetical protein KFE25_001938 [Diacronema lutheri]
MEEGGVDPSEDQEDCSSLPPFLSKLYELVDSPTAKHIVWGKNGQTFRILSATLFARDLLPLYFKHNSIASFTRQLLTYGFKRCHSPPGGGPMLEFGHEHFKQGDRAALRLIRRRVASKKVRGSGPFPPSSSPHPPPSAPAAQVGTQPSMDNMMLFQLERLRNHVVNVERQFQGSMVEIYSLLSEMERHAHASMRAGGGALSAMQPAPIRPAMPVTAPGGVRLVDPTHQAARHSQPPQSPQLSQPPQGAPVVMYALQPQAQFGAQCGGAPPMVFCMPISQAGGGGALYGSAHGALPPEMAAQQAQHQAPHPPQHAQHPTRQHAQHESEDAQHQQVASGLVRLSRGAESEQLPTALGTHARDAQPPAPAYPDAYHATPVPRHGESSERGVHPRAQAGE